jgi:hypothetical protein
MTLITVDNGDIWEDGVDRTPPTVAFDDVKLSCPELAALVAARLAEYLGESQHEGSPVSVGDFLTYFVLTEGSDQATGQPVDVPRLTYCETCAMAVAPGSIWPLGGHDDDPDSPVHETRSILVTPR